MLIDLQLRQSLSECIHVTLYHSSSGLENLADLFEKKASTMDRKLKQLIGQVRRLRLLSLRMFSIQRSELFVLNFELSPHFTF